MPKPYPKEFRDDVVAVARRRDPGTPLRQIATDFGISEPCLNNWLAAAEREDGTRSGPTASELSENRVLKKRVRLLGPETEGLRGAAAYLSQANVSPKGSTRSS